MPIDLDSLEDYFASIPGSDELGDADLIALFGYYLQKLRGQTSFKPKEIDLCFSECHLNAPTWTRVYLNKHSKGREAKFIKLDSGYKLSRNTLGQIEALKGLDFGFSQTNSSLESLRGRIPTKAEADFLEEVLVCFRVGANRATITLMWILTIDHLYTYILKFKTAEFNAVLVQNKDKRVKVKMIAKRDDFNEIPESLFIKFCREAKIISNDVRRILEEKLGTRNSSAHPSGITIRPSKVVDFVEDLVENVLLKHPLTT